MSSASELTVKTSHKSTSERKFVVLTNILGTYPEVSYRGDVIKESQLANADHTERLLKEGLICLEQDRPRKLKPWDYQEPTKITHGGDDDRIVANVKAIHESLVNRQPR